MKNQRGFFLKRFFIGGIICFIFCSALIAQNDNQYTLKNAKEYFDLWDNNSTDENYELIWKAYKIYDEFAKNGNADAQYVMANIYLYGFKGKENGAWKIIEYNCEEGYKWLQSAAEQGHPDAQMHLSSYYLGGNCVPENKTKELEWLKKAANQGHTFAMSRLGTEYYVQNDCVSAITWWQLSGFYEKIYYEVNNVENRRRFFNDKTKDMFEKDKKYWYDSWLKSCNNPEIYRQYIPKRYISNFNNLDEYRIMGFAGEDQLFLYTCHGNYKFSKEDEIELIRRLKSWNPLVTWNPTNESQIKSGKPEYAIKSTPSPKELKPDGVSTSEIEAVLYEYIPDDPNSSKPLSNKKVTFRIGEQYGITPGSLSAYEGYTDAYGRTKVIYTAPDANSISNQNIITATVVARSDEYNKEDIAYLHFRFDRGGVNVEPNMKGVISNYGIVPPDKRYPAKISAYIEDDGGHKKINTGVKFSLSGNKTYGLLRTSNGQTGTSVNVISDANGYAEVEYFYNSDVLTDNDAMETVDIKSDGMSRTLKAYIYIGLNLVIESAISGYEGRGIINAGEEIPVKIKLKSLRYPDEDLNKFLYHWSNPGIRVKLEIKPQGNVPDYLLDKLKLEKFPQPEFNQVVSLKSFKDKKEFNYLWVSEYSILNYQGYPKITPTIPGQTNYEISVSLVDDNGQPLQNDIQQTAFISIETGLPADAFSIFFLENPFGPHTDQAVFFRTVLDLAGYGLLLNIADVAFAINRGNTTDIVGTILSALKDVMLDKAKLKSDWIKIYTEVAYTEKVASLALGEMPIATIENALISKIASLSTWGDKILIVLHGNGNQRLLDAKTNSPVPVQENSITTDDNLKTVSVKNGNVSVYLVPPDLDYKLENYTKKIEQGAKKETKKEESKAPSFSGSWETADFGTVSFVIAGSDVVATCTKNLAGMKGKLSSDGTKITGTWAKFPTYSSPNDAGLFSITISSDGKSFTGFWGKGTDSSAKLDKPLNGKKK